MKNMLIDYIVFSFCFVNIEGELFWEQKCAEFLEGLEQSSGLGLGPLLEVF